MNTIDDLLFKQIISLIFTYLRRETQILRAVMREPVEAQIMESKRGKKVTFALPSPFASDAIDVIPSPTQPATPPLDLQDVELVLDQWKEQSYTFTSLELSRLSEGQGMSREMEGCIDSVCRTVVKYVLDQLRLGVFNFTGTAGTTPFASNLTPLTKARQILKNAGASKMRQSAILNFDAEANMLNNALLIANPSRVDQGVFTLSTGEIGSKLFGMDIGSDYYAPDHTRGTISSLVPLVNGAVVAGATTAQFDLGVLTGTLVQGDLFSVAGSKQTYVITATATAAANAINVSFLPKVPVGTTWADNAQVTIVDNHACNFFLQEQGFVFASRPVDEGPKFQGSVHSYINDPETGINLMIEIVPGHAQTMLFCRCLYGGKLARPELTGVILG